MSGTYSLLITLIPTLLFVLIVLIAIILGIIRGFRKSLILAIQALAAFIICIILFAILANNSQVDTNLVNIVNNFMGQGGLQRQMGVSESSTSVTEILYEFIPKQMDYGDGLALILRENGQYLLQLVLFVYRLILAIICLFIYFLLVFIFYIIYLIFYPERRYKKKVEEGYASLNSEKTYKKRRLYGSLIGLLRGLVGGIVIMAFIGSFFYIAGGTGNKKYNDQLEVNDTSLKEGYQIYEALGSYGTSGIFKVLNTIKVKDNMPFYLYAADLVFSGRINDPERGINVKFNFADEMGAYTTFTRETIDLLMKYGKEDLIKAINANDNIMNTVLKIMDMPEFQEEFNLLIDNFNAKTYFINFSLSLLDSIVAHIDQLKIAETSPDMVETISLMFKKGYLSKYIPEEQEILDQLKTNPNYEYETRPFITASNLLTKEDAKSLLKFVVAAIELDETKDDAYKIMTFSENLLPSLGELTILNGKRESEFNDVYERLYFYLDNRYIQTALQQDSGSVEYDRSDVILRGIETEKLDWTTEIKELLNSSANVLGIARSVYDPNKEVFNNVISMFDSTNPDAQSNEQKYDAIVDSLKKSELLNKVMSSNGMSAYIRNMLQSSIPTIYVPKVNYMNIKNPDGTETNGEAYNLLVGFKSILKNTNTRVLLNDFKKLSSGDTESTNYVRSLLYAMNTTEGGVKPIDTALESSLLRAVFTGAITSNATGSLEIILPDSILEEENGVKVNVIQKEELVNTIDTLLTIMPESGEINQVTLIKEILANKESLVSSAIISASAINMMVNDPKNSLQGVLVIPDEYKAAATKEELRKYSSANIWSSSDELLHLLDGLDKGFGLQESEFDLNDQDAAAELIKANIKKLNDKVSEGSNETKLDVCFNSIIIKASITNHMQGDDVKGLIIPIDAFDDNDTIKVDNVDKKNICKSEISLLVDIANRLDIDLSKADIENILLKKADVPTLVESKIFRATMDVELTKNRDLVIPNDEGTSTSTKANGYISEYELNNFLNVLTNNREAIFGTTDENEKVNVKTVSIDTEKVKSFKLEFINDLTDSNILSATIINKLCASGDDYGINVPNKLAIEAEKEYLEDNFINTNWYLKNELENMFDSFINIFGNDTVIGDIDEESLKDKIFEDGFVNKCYASIVLNNTISVKLSEKLDTLNSDEVTEYSKEDLASKYDLNESDFNETVYKEAEIDKLLVALKALGINDISSVDETFDYTNAILNDSLNMDNLYASIIVWDILTNKLDETLESNPNTVSHSYAYEQRFGLNTLFIKQNEVTSIRTLIKSSGDNVDLDNFNTSDITLTDTNKEAILDSYILMATVTKNVSSSSDLVVPADAYLIPTEEDMLINETDISDLLDVADILNVDLGNPNVDKLKLDLDNNVTLAKSIIFRATLYKKLNENEDVVVPDLSLQKAEANNTYLYYAEAKLVLDKITMHKQAFFTEDSEGMVDITSFTYDDTKLTLNTLDDLTDSNIFTVTMINKIGSSDSYGINVPTKLANEAQKDYIKANYINTNWFIKNELNNMFDSFIDIFGSDKVISEIGEDAIKDKIFEDGFVNKCYVSIVLNNTISAKLSEKLDTLNSDEVTLYSKEDLASKYDLNTSDFTETVYKEDEIDKLLVALKALGINDISSVDESFDYTNAILNDSLDMDKLYASIIVWDILTDKLDETLEANPNTVSHSYAYEQRYGLSTLFIKQIEVTSIRTIIKSSGDDVDLDNFAASNIELTTSNKEAILDSYILMATVTKNVSSSSDIIVPTDAYLISTEVDKLINESDISDLLDVADILDIDLGNPSVDKLKLDLNNNATLAKSIIFRATLYKKLGENEDVVVPDLSLQKAEANNTYLYYAEAKLVLDKITVHKDAFFTADSEGMVDITTFTYDDTKLTLNTAKDLIESEVLYATVTYKVGTIEGITIPSMHVTYTTKANLEHNFINNIWYNEGELNKLFDAISIFVPDTTPISDINDDTVDDKILDLSNDDLTIVYESVVMKASLTNNIESTLTDNGARTETKENCKVQDAKYSAPDYKFFTQSEIYNAILSLRELGFEKVSDFENITDYSNLVKNEEVDYSVVDDSVLVWDVIYVKMHEIITSNTSIVEHNKSVYLEFEIPFYHKEEIEGIREFMIGSDIESLDGINVEDIKVTDETLSSIDLSYIIRATISKNITDNDTVVIPYDTYEFSDINLIKAEELKSLLGALKASTAKTDGTYLSFHDFDSSTLAPSDITYPNELTNSSILMATISSQVKGDGTIIYTTEASIDNDYLNNSICVITGEELINLITAIKVFGDSFTIELNFQILSNLTIDEQYTIMNSNILAYVVSELLVNGVTISGLGTISYETYMYTQPTIDIPGHGTYDLTLNGMAYKFKTPAFTNPYKIEAKEIVNDVKLLTADDVVAFIIALTI